jgi:ABC-type proline/glycine betaine transport system permease subunit
MTRAGTAKARPRSRPVTKQDMPSGVTGKLSLFDRFATAADRVVSGAWFFAFCLLLVIVWAPSYFLIRDINTWQLIINTLTTIVTFLLVALLQNTQRRADEAIQHKLNAIADALADFMERMAEDRPDLREDYTELRAAVGLEKREGS